MKHSQAYQLLAPDDLVHDGMVNTGYRRTVCEHRYGDRWNQESLLPTEAVTTCLRCLAESDRTGLQPYERAR